MFDGEVSRRDLLTFGSAWIAAVHLPGFANGFERVQSKKPRAPLIRRVGLLTSAPIDEMEEFYCGKLGYRRIEKTKTVLSVAAGATELLFKSSPRKGHGPLTHFAFNVPQNKIRSVLDWTKKRIPIIPAWGDLADPALPKEIVHFRHWNAHSVFFWDPAQNVVEFIARHDLDNGSSGAFSIGDVYCVSEIGLPTRDPVAMAKQIQADLGVKAYPAGTAPQFAMGDVNGLLLCLREGQAWGDHTKTPVEWEAYETKVEISGATEKSLKVDQYPYSVTCR